MACVVLARSRMNVAAVEQARVASHLLCAEERARRSKSPRDRVRAIVRALLLDELARYREGGVFPKNRDFPDRAMPYFVDADGTRCAMAHLLEVGGQAALVERIARERNNAFVRELADESELLAWLDAAGISVEEAAAIQPSYCDVPAANICGGSFQRRTVDAAGVIEVKLDGDMQGTVAAIYGESGGLAIGERVSIGRSGNEKVTLVPVPREGFSRAKDTGTAVLGRGIGFDTNGILQDSGEHPLTREQVISAVSKPTTAECREELASIDAWYGNHDQSCEEQSTVGACNVERVGELAAASPASVAILIAVVSTLLARRMSQAKRACR